jgi:hypothetical protein
MAEVVKLLTHAYTDFLVHGHIPPTDVIKQADQQGSSLASSAGWSSTQLILAWQYSRCARLQMLGYGILVFSTLVKLPQVGAG